MVFFYAFKFVEKFFTVNSLIFRWQLWIQITSTGMIIMKSFLFLFPIVDHIGVDLIMKLSKKITKPLEYVFQQSNICFIVKLLSY